jgi:glycine betaine/proline transport system substrate-binding protein
MLKRWLQTILMLVAVGGAHAADKPTLRIGWTAWSDAEAVSRLAAEILESRLNQPVELVLLDIGIQYQGLADGEIDAMLMAWLPLTHKPYMDKVRDRVVDLGPLYSGARLGWVVPDYIPANQLNSIEDLRDSAVARRLGRQIYGIDPGAGLMQASERALEDYGLERYRLVSSSGAGMTAALARAIKRKKWIVVTGWSPHWMFSRWKLRYLEDPRQSLGGGERVHALVRQGFDNDFPAVVSDFLSRMYLPLGELETLMDEANDSSYEQAVKDYIANHQRRIEYWVTGNISPCQD